MRATSGRDASEEMTPASPFAQTKLAIQNGRCTTPARGELVEERRLGARGRLAQLLEDVAPLGELGPQGGRAGEIGLLGEDDQELALARGLEDKLVEHPGVDFGAACSLDLRREGEHRDGAEQRGNESGGGTQAA